MTNKEKEKLLGFRQWLIAKEEEWHEKSKDVSNSRCCEHYCRGNADGLIRARAEYETLFDFLDDY